jgi:hypothetical protein
MIDVKCSVIISPEEAYSGQFTSENKLKMDTWKEKFRKVLTVIPTPTGSMTIVDILEITQNTWIVRTNNPQLNSKMDQLLKKYFPEQMFTWTL